MASKVGLTVLPPWGVLVDLVT